MRVLINAFSARQGGGQTYLRNLLDFLPAHLDLEVFLLVPESLRFLANKPNVTVLPVAWPVENPVVRAVWERLRLPRLIKQLNAEVLFCPGGILGAKPPSGCKTVTMFRNMIPFDYEIRKRYPLGYMRARNWILEKLMLESMMRADLVIFISEFAKTVIGSRSGGQLNQTVVIPHGINKRFFRVEADQSQAPDWLPREGYFLYVSALDVYKAQMEVVRGYVLAKQRAQIPHKLILAGPENRAYGDRVRREIRKLGAQDDVILTGPIPYDELPAVYQNAALNIFASELENCPNILLEALAAGRPILCSNRPPMPEFGRDAVVYFDPASPDELADKLLCLLGAPAEMTRLSEIAPKYARGFDWEAAADATWRSIAGLVWQSQS